MFDFCQMDQRRRRDALDKIIKFWSSKEVNLTIHEKSFI